MRSAAALDADEIHHEAADVLDKVEAWLREHGRHADPGRAAIRAAGVPVPPEVAKYGTPMKGLAEHLRGLRWALAAYVDLTRDKTPDAILYIEGPADGVSAASQVVTNPAEAA